MGNLTVDQDQLVDGISCGPGGELPSVVIPPDHMTAGVPDTDVIVYISLAFATNRTNSSSATTENSTTVIDTSDGGNKIPNDRSYRRVSNTTDDDQHEKKCSGDYHAASAFCSTDQFDRPTAAILHICIGDDFFANASVSTNIMVVLHEIGHALGFNAVSLAHFRRPDGTPFTERDPTTGEVPLVEINCTGPVSQQLTERIAVPSDDILQFRTVRGGVRVAEVVTPSVRQVARNHFDCQDLPGAELESGEFLPLSTNPGEVSCLGDHWERRLFKSDLMNPLVDDSLEFSARFSTITLAYFADSGWYQVDLSRASVSASWGRAAGCDFVDKTCIQANDGQVPTEFSPYFCNQASLEESGYSSEIHGCTIDLSRKASCSLDHYEGELPPAYQYFNFSFGANVGGNDPFMDYCPVYSGFANGLCSDVKNEALIRVNLVERFGQRNSKCLSGQVRRLGVNVSNVKSESNQSSIMNGLVTEATALCLPIACVVEDRSLRIQVNGVWEVCNNKGDIIVPSAPIVSSRATSSGNDVVNIVCPDPIRICPTFYCDVDCLGTNRVCDYNVGKCVCNSAKVVDDYHSWNETSFAAIASSRDADEYAICVAPNTSHGGGSPQSFYRADVVQDDNGLPSADSPLADYYVPTARNLSADPTGFWTTQRKGISSGISVFISLVVTLLVFLILRRHRRSVQVAGDVVEDAPAGAGASNADKHKLMASVVVNLRMNDADLRRRADVLDNRNSETDVSMTDTDGSGDAPSFPEFSARDSTHDAMNGTIADLSGSDYGIVSRLGLMSDHEYVDPLAPPSTTSPVVRRRHIFNTFR